MTNSDRSVGAYTSKVLVRQYEQGWYISNISSDSVAEQLKQKIRDYQTDRYVKMGLQQLDVSLLSLSIYNKEVFAYFNTKVSHKFDYNTVSAWPEQKGRIKYLEANRQNLSPEQIKKIQDKIDFWNKELQKNIESNIRTVDEDFFVRVNLDNMNRIIEQNVLLNIQNFLNPEDYTEVTPLPLEEELESRGYAEMMQLVE